MSFSSLMINYLFKKGDDKRDEGLTTPENIIRYDNIKYGENDKWQILDVYRPRESSGEKLPVIISVHGGGWVYGDKERYQYYCMSLSQRGFAVVNFTYRLAPKYKFPAPLEDTNLVCEWVIQNANKYKFDTSRIFGVGDSAGAHNLGLHVAMCTNKDYENQFTFKKPEGFTWRAVALNCGQYAMSYEKKKELTNKLMRDYLPNKGTEEELKKVDVISHVTNAFPPTFVMTAENDFLKMQAPLLVEKLKELDIPYTYKLYGDESNPLAHVFHCNMKSEDARICNDEECDFFRTFDGHIINTR